MKLGGGIRRGRRRGALGQQGRQVYERQDVIGIDRKSQEFAGELLG